jgi:hypothetical protein
LRLGRELVIRTPIRFAIAGRSKDKTPFRELLGNSNFGNFVVAFRAGKVEVTQNPVSRQVDERIGLLPSFQN